MATRKRDQFQIDSTDEIRKRSKAVAFDRGFPTLMEFVYDALKKEKDVKLNKLIDEFLANRPQRGRSPQDK